MIINRPNVQVMSAINRLNQTDDFQKLLELIRSELKEVDKMNRHQVDVVQLHQGQGVAKALEKLLETCENAAKTVALQQGR